MKKILSICVILLIATTVYAESLWEYKAQEDKMSGEITDFVQGGSKNTLTGWLSSSKVYFYYICKNPTIQIQVSGIGLHVDNVECDSYSCENIQNARVKFDKDPPQNIYFNINDDNNDAMSLSTYWGSKTISKTKEIISAMKAGTTMYLEITPFNSKGKRQIAEFNLNGFTAAINQCK